MSVILNRQDHFFHANTANSAAAAAVNTPNNNNNLHTNQAQNAHFHVGSKPGAIGKYFTSPVISERLTNRPSSRD